VSFHVDSIAANLLKCKFQIRDVVWQKYSCVIEEFKTDFWNWKVSSISDNHYESRADDDVQTLTIEKSETFQYFTNDLFVKFSRIQNLLVHSTNLEYLLPGDFENAQHLTNAHLLTELPNNVFHGARVLKSLNLSNNRIRQIDDDAFKSISLLKNLVLSFNEIKKLNVNLFQKLTYLDSLSLSGNQIRSIHETLFRGNRNLRVLFLSDNRIKTFNGRVFKHNKRLQAIYMDNNRIQRISEKSTFLSHLDDLEIAAFDNNICVNTTIVLNLRPLDEFQAQKYFEKCTPCIR
jgi:Leucine rich repeat